MTAPLTFGDRNRRHKGVLKTTIKVDYKKKEGAFEMTVYRLAHHWHMANLKLQNTPCSTI
jgi:hypothetical protein